ncbi:MULTISPECIES: hypothetical protein [unclassified Acidocella]|uniref:hypothetical protein n=1 Tax=unclassified Acidocella TaxID=2648610 RepID=UPI00028D8BBF|nr:MULTISPECIES: hypothetical protein [unclassified Acidocella]EKN01091.1 hypothetical protein MXAZACID_02259 [Acidocella sp. MX-AZ02]WBO60581.1 hypothetical protein GT370_07360 [Acidocella sp. MX-AZ03]
MCKIAHMLDRRKIREEHQQLIKEVAKEAGLKPSALATQIGVRPSTLNKVMDEKHTHLLSASTVSLLKTFRDAIREQREAESPFFELTATPYGTTPQLEGAVDVDTEVLSNLLDSPENKKLLGLWIEMDTATKLATLDILEAVTRIARRKAG